MSSFQTSAIKTSGISAITPASTFDLLTNVSGAINIGTTGTQTTTVNGKLTSTGMLTASAGITSNAKITVSSLETNAPSAAANLFNNISNANAGISIGNTNGKCVAVECGLLTIKSGGVFDVATAGQLNLGTVTSNNVSIGSAL